MRKTKIICTLGPAVDSVFHGADDFATLNPVHPDGHQAVVN